MAVELVTLDLSASVPFQKIGIDPLTQADEPLFPVMVRTHL
ncbi:hypothetical protein [Lentzea alba]|nr:hypothetical protein [Lentzea alba]